MISRAILVAFALWCTAPSARADEAHHESRPTAREVWSNTQYVGQVFNFCLLLVLLIVLGRKAGVPDFLRSRRQRVESALAEAERMKAEAEAKFREYEERLKGLHTELEKVKLDIVRAGEEERDRIVAKAEAKAARLREEAKLRIELQTKLLRDELIREAVQAAVSTAEAVLRDQITENDQERIARDYLVSLARTLPEERPR